MHFKSIATLFAVATLDGAAFSPSSMMSSFQNHNHRHVEPTTKTTKLHSLVEVLVEVSSESTPEEIVSVEEEKEEDCVGSLSAELINSRLEKQLEKMRLKDQTSKQLTKEDLVLIHEDENIVVVDKPSGVLTVSGKGYNPSLADVVHEHIKSSLPSGDHMVVHRLGMDTSGLIIMAKNRNAVRELNALFRERNIVRKYEALVAGHMEKDDGLINLPIMRDYQCPPYVRISTDDHQWALVDLTAEDVEKKLLEGPKDSITKYEVIDREFLQGQPVTRITLTSFSGRYHQLNVHMAAFGHPIVGDNVYGINGDALPNGGLTKRELEKLIPNPKRADDETQILLNESVRSKELPPCVHAKYIKFTHPVTKKIYEFRTKSPF